MKEKYDAARLAKTLGRDEGLRLKPYRCTAGKLTIGIGRNLDDRGISKAEAAVMFQNDLDGAVAELDRALPWWRELNAVRQEVLINMAFNLGMPGLLKFVNTLAAVQRGDYERAAKGMRVSLWARQVGSRAERLAREMETGTLG
jgi:lysozyme